MKRELIFTFCCLLTTLVWSQEYQRTETGIKASIFGKKIDVELQYMILWKSNKGQNEKKS